MDALTFTRSTKLVHAFVAQPENVLGLRSEFLTASITHEEVRGVSTSGLW